MIAKVCDLQFCPVILNSMRHLRRNVGIVCALLDSAMSEREASWQDWRSKWGIDPERDIWSLGVMVQGSGQMGELLGRRRRCRRRRHLEIGVWNSFCFRAWTGFIWEISAHPSVHPAWNLGARLFWKTKTKHQEQFYFQYFQDIRKMEKTNFQYFQDMRT